MKKLISTGLALVLALGLGLPAFAIAAKSIRMNRPSLTMTIGNTATLRVKFTPTKDLDGDPVSEPLSWRSSDEEVATVQDGTVTAVGRGEAVITAQTDSGLRTTCLVTVRKEGQYVTELEMELALDSVTVRVDQTRMLAAYIRPSDASYKDVTWTSSDPEVATVDLEGVVTGVAPGQATITAESDRGIQAQCLVTVPERVVSGIQNDVTVSASGNSAEKLTSSVLRSAIQEAVKNAGKNEKTVTVSFNGKTSASSATLRGGAYSAERADSKVQLCFRTLSDDGKTEGTLIFNATSAKSCKNETGLAVRVSSTKAKDIEKKVEKSYQAEVAVIDLSQTEDFEFNVKITARTDLGDASADNLYFYSYKNGSIGRAEASNIKLKSDGTLQFTTTTGSTIVVSNGKLVK